MSESGYEAVARQIWERAPCLPAGGGILNEYDLVADALQYVGSPVIRVDERQDLLALAADILHLDNQGEQ